MTEQEIKAKTARIYELKDEIRERENAISEIEGEIRGHYIEEAEKKFPDFKRGDKVMVTAITWTYKGYEEYTEGPFIYFGARYNKYAYELNASRIEYVFREIKRNGEPAKKEHAYFGIVKLEKVTE